MKARLALLAAVFASLVLPLAAQETESDGQVYMTAEEFDALLGPLALHPDALVALILPATTVPTDIVLAARFLRAGGEADKFDEQTWDESVRALARYPEIIQWLDEELPWTVRVGEAFAADPAGVMQSIQRLRARASAAGTLTSTHQQKVIVEEDIISIVPASRQVIYVPTYDPLVVYTPVHDVRFRTYLHFGFGRPVGGWLRYDCDWWSRRIWCYDWDRNRRHDWDRGRIHYRDRRPEIPGARPWRPREDRSRDDLRRRPHRLEVVAAPRFDADPPVRNEVDERRIQPRRPIDNPPNVRRVTVPRVDPDRRIDVRERRRDGTEPRTVHARTPDIERQPRVELAPRVEREPRVNLQPRVDREPRVVRVPPVNVGSPPRGVVPRVPVQAPTVVTAPRVEPATPIAPSEPPSERRRAIREKNER